MRRFRLLDTDGSGSIDLNEYIRFSLRDALRRGATRVIDLFRRWDGDNSGSITKSEFREAVRHMGFEWFEDQSHVDRVFDDMDLDGDGTIEYKELHKQLRAGASIQLDKKLLAGGAGEIEVTAKNKTTTKTGAPGARPVGKVGRPAVWQYLLDDDGNPRGPAGTSGPPSGPPPRSPAVRRADFALARVAAARHKGGTLPHAQGPVIDGPLASELRCELLARLRAAQRTLEHKARAVGGDDDDPALRAARQEFAQQRLECLRLERELEVRLAAKHETRHLSHATSSPLMAKHEARHLQYAASSPSLRVAWE